MSSLKKSKKSSGLFVPPLPKEKSKVHLRELELKLCNSLPPCKIKKVVSNNVYMLSYPSGDNDNETDKIYPQADGLVISLYPYIPERKARDGDPICDSFRVHAHDNGTVWCIADGCNWGEKPRQASIKAKDAFVGYMYQKISECKTLKDLSSQLINAIATSHEAIIHGKKDIFTAGTTTLLGGAIVMYDDKEQKDWLVCCVSIGDCKLFHYCAETCTVSDMTYLNRAQVQDAKDPGGRLGPYLGDEGNPDLRNLDMQYKIVKEGDLLIAVSDGVHDNLDPVTIGKDPKDLGLSFESWKDISKDLINRARVHYMCDTLNNLIKSCPQVTPTLVSRKIIEHVTNVIENGKQFLEQNPDGVLVGTDYKVFPGKMDHSTCVCMKVGTRENLNQRGPQSLYPEVFPY